MRTVKCNELSFEVKGLTGRQIKTLKADGIPISRMGVDTGRLGADQELAERTLDAVIAMALEPEQQEHLDDLPNSQVLAVWSAVLKETFGAPGEEKN